MGLNINLFGLHHTDPPPAHVFVDLATASHSEQIRCGVKKGDKCTQARWHGDKAEWITENNFQHLILDSNKIDLPYVGSSGHMTEHNIYTMRF